MLPNVQTRDVREGEFIRGTEHLWSKVNTDDVLNRARFFPSTYINRVNLAYYPQLRDIDEGYKNGYKKGGHLVHLFETCHFV